MASITTQISTRFIQHTKKKYIVISFEPSIKENNTYTASFGLIRIRRFDNVLTFLLFAFNTCPQQYTPYYT